MAKKEKLKKLTDEEYERYVQSLLKKSEYISDFFMPSVR